MRRLEITAGAQRWQGGRDIWSTNQAMRHAERELALQAQRAYERTINDWQPPRKAGAGATPGRASQRPSKRQSSAADLKPQRSALCSVSHPHPNRTLPQEPAPIQTT